MTIDQDYVRERFRIREAFRPSAPINIVDLFAGRVKQIEQLVDAISEVGGHAILYGERGVGKTSLSMILQAFTPRGGMPFVRINCDRKSTFTGLWHQILNQITIAEPVMKQDMPFGSKKKPGQRQIYRPLSEFLSKPEISPDDIRVIFGQRQVRCVIVIDEIDKIEDVTVRGLLADTIKTLSDHASPLTIILVGVADSVDQLIHDHQSINRALTQVQMERMARYELSDALHKCLETIGMTIYPEADNLITMLSMGLPHYTHLLGQQAALIAFESGRKTIAASDAFQAIFNALKGAQQTIISAYTDATYTNRATTLHQELLLACALADTNDLGYFTASEVRRELGELTGKHYEISHFARIIADFASDKRGNILQRAGKPRRYTYRFSDPLMQPFVIMRGIEDELIEYDKIARILA